MQISCPDACQLCGKHFQTLVYDAYLPLRGGWAWICPECARAEGVRTGNGRGQLYNRTPNGEWIKLKG